ncbi:unnamed protein product [Leptosia nina]|uniref:Mismatch repair endonuclease PMS2 n=1 Tax=Leptosia nina TaxID=320188 RepID=A0AAV1K305_9NEOP
MEKKEKCIKPINKDTVHKICSGQVVLSLAVAVKELLENSLDASATNVDIRLKNYGIDLIEVSDNGSGVTEDNFSALTLKYHTSKLSDYSDLLGVSSFGFRGEALSSLCSLASLTITTRHGSSEYATKIEYDHKGHITSKTRCSRQVGTTVTLSNLFHTLPVRQKEFHKNSKREFNKMTNLLYAYCLISKGIKITCSNQTSSNSKSVVVATSGSLSYKDNIACVFGHKQLQNIIEIKTELASTIKENIFKGLSGEVKETNETVEIEDVDIDLSEDSNDAEVSNSQTSHSDRFSLSQKSHGYKNMPSPVDLEGFISSCEHGCGRSSTDRQFYYINSRPCEPTKVIKLVNETYKQFNSNQYPFVFLNINIDRISVDVNVTPDKRKVFLTKEKGIIDVLKASLTKLFENIPSTFKLNTTSIDLSKGAQANLSQPTIFNSFMQQFSKKEDKTNENNYVHSDKKSIDLKRKSTILLDSFLSKTKKITHDEKLKIKSEENSNSNISNDSADAIEDKSSDDDQIQKPESKVKGVNVDDNQNELGRSQRKSVPYRTSLDHIKQLNEIYKKNNKKCLPERLKFRSRIDPVFNKKCEEELSKEISKGSFKQMQIIGQFNLGFIITRLEDDLFIIDQHASDEIYNFETLQKNTELTSQKLVIPQQLELTGVNEQILIDNLDIFKKNGFTFEIEENALPTKRVKLLTIPMSKNWIFGKDDIEELLFMIKESPSEYCRPSRVRAMFASRACRKSVMIGTALGRADMKQLVDHMAEIDKPWNCPHGRPTIRHLINLAMVSSNST